MDHGECGLDGSAAAAGSACAAVVAIDSVVLAEQELLAAALSTSSCACTSGTCADGESDEVVRKVDEEELLEIDELFAALAGRAADEAEESNEKFSVAVADEEDVVMAEEEEKELCVFVSSDG